MKPIIIELIVYLGLYAIATFIIYQLIKRLIKFGINYYFQKKDKKEKQQGE